jgi:hypothetical protein
MEDIPILTDEEFQRLIDRRNIPQEWFDEDEEYPFVDPPK